MEMVDFDVVEASTAPFGTIGSFGSWRGNNTTNCSTDELSLRRCLRGSVDRPRAYQHVVSELRSLLFWWFKPLDRSQPAA
jgi:hypothetical protein